jgi:ABC-type amino acid transport substrate-binding protein
MKIYLQRILSLCLLLVALLSQAAQPVINVIYYSPVDKQSVNLISAKLWNKVAEVNGLHYVFLPTTDITQAYRWLQEGTGKIIIGPLKADFKQPHVDYLDTYISAQTGVLINAHAHLGVWDRIIVLILMIFLKAVFFLLLFVTLTGIVLWLLERKHPQSDFAGKALPGIGRAIWLQINTFSTVGLGDFVPRTVAGRTWSSIVIFVCVFTVSTFTASITAEATLLASQAAYITRLPDLQETNVAYIRGEDTVLADIQKFDGHPYPVDNIEQLFAALQSRHVVAGFAQRIKLRAYLNQHPNHALRLTPFFMNHGKYAFAIKSDPSFENKINRTLYTLDTLGEIDKIIDQEVGDDNIGLAQSNAV